MTTVGFCMSLEADLLLASIVLRLFLRIGLLSSGDLGGNKVVQ